MNEHELIDLIVEWLVDNTQHIVHNQAVGKWELIEFDDSYLEILVYDLSYDEENAVYDFERKFNRDYAGEWEMEISPESNYTRHTIVCRRAY